MGKKGIGVPGLNRNDVHKSMIPDVPVIDQKRILKEIMTVNDQLVDADMKRLAIIDKYLC